MSEPVLIQQDEEHLRLLRIFHFVCAGMVALLACIPILHLAFGLVMLFAPDAFGQGSNHPPRIFGLIFAVLAGMFIFLGWTFAALLAWAGRNLGRRKHYTFCFVMACLACMFMPFGTLLGAFTIIVLMRPSVKLMFAQPAPA